MSARPLFGASWVSFRLERGILRHSARITTPYYTERYIRAIGHASVPRLPKTGLHCSAGPIGWACQMDLKQLSSILLPGVEYSDEKRSFFDTISQISSDIFLGDYSAARDQALLESKGVTHIVQCLQVSWNDEPFKVRYL